MASELLEGGTLGEDTPLLEGNKPPQEWCSKLKDLIIVSMPPFILFGIGVAALMHFEGWDLIVSSYVITQMVTTIGYGDFTVRADAAKLFMALYALFVLVLLAYYYNLIVGRLVQWESAALRKYFRRLEVFYDDEVFNESQALARYGRVNDAVAGLALFLFALVSGTVFFRFVEHCSCSTGMYAVDGCNESSFISCRDTGGYVKDWTESFYLACITLTTIGFGDYQARTTVGRLFGMGWMLVGVATTTLAIVSLSTLIFEEKKDTQFSAIEDDPKIDDDIFGKIDQDGNGALSRAEFITYTLVKYGIVKEDLLNDIHKQFDKLDPKGTNAVTLSMIQDLKKDRISRHGSMSKSMSGLFSPR